MTKLLDLLHLQVQSKRPPSLISILDVLLPMWLQIVLQPDVGEAPFRQTWPLPAKAVPIVNRSEAINNDFFILKTPC